MKSNKVWPNKITLMIFSVVSLLLITGGTYLFGREQGANTSPMPMADASALYEGFNTNQRRLTVDERSSESYGEDYSPAHGENSEESYEGAFTAVFDEIMSLYDGVYHIETFPDAPYPALPEPVFQYENMLTAAWATPETMGTFDAFEHFYDSSQGVEQVVFSSSIELVDFRFIALGFNEAELYFYEAETLFILDELLPDKPFIVNWQENDHLPHRGAAFMDAFNYARYFFITTDMPYGDINLVEFWPGVSIVSG